MTSAAIRPKALLALMIGATLFLLLSAAPARAATFVVNTTADAPDSNPGDGRCAAAPMVCTLRAAVMEHNALGGSNEIKLRGGIHVLTVAGKEEDNALTGDLDVIGGSLDVIGASPSILGGRTVIDANQLDRIWDLGPPTCPTCMPISRPTQFDLRRVTLQNGRVVSTPPDLSTSGRDVGGAVRILLNSGLRIKDALIQNNTAGARGGGFAMPPSAATVVGADPAIITELTDVRIANNSAGVEGGALFNNRVAIFTRVIIEDNTVTGTATTGPNQPRGAGIAQSGDLTFTDVLIDGNSMPIGNGGGIANRGDPVAQIFGTIRLNRVTVSNNSVPGGNGQGGGIANGNGATAYLTNTTISHNTAGFAGGGLVNGGTATLDFVTVANNSAPGGASIFTAGPPLGAVSASARLTATILKVDAGQNCLGPPPFGGPPFARLPVSGGDNISSDFSCALMGPNDRNGINPLLGPLAHNGGFTPTHALLLGSPAIDTVLFNPCPPPLTDQRRVERPQDGNSDGTAICDVGSYELKGHDDEDDDTILGRR